MLKPDNQKIQHKFGYFLLTLFRVDIKNEIDIS